MADDLSVFRLWVSVPDVFCPGSFADSISVWAIFPVVHYNSIDRSRHFADVFWYSHKITSNIVHYIISGTIFQGI